MRTFGSHSVNNKFLDFLLGTTGLANDAALSRFLGVSPSIISKLRRGNYAFSAALIIRVHEKTQMPISAIKEALA